VKVFEGGKTICPRQASKKKYRQVHKGGTSAPVLCGNREKGNGMFFEEGDLSLNKDDTILNLVRESNGAKTRRYACI